MSIPTYLPFRTVSVTGLNGVESKTLLSLPVLIILRFSATGSNQIRNDVVMTDLSYTAVIVKLN